MPGPVVDFHIHPMVPEGGPLQPSVMDFMRQHVGDDLPTLLERARDPAWFDDYLRSAGVDYAVILGDQCPIASGIIPNEDLASYCAGRPHWVPFASVNPYLVQQPANEVARAVRELGCRGLKLYPTYQHFYPNDAKVYPIYAAAEELGIPVMLHTGSSVFRGSRLKYGDPLFLDDVAIDFPSLKLIMAHSGRPLWYETAFLLAGIHPNVYMEISGLPPQKLLSYFPHLQRNADKVIFGSDWPGLPSIGHNIAAIRRLPLSETTKDKILGGNALRVLGLPSASSQAEE